MKARFTTAISFLLIFFSNFNSSYSQVFWNEVNSGISVALRCVSDVNSYIAWCSGVNGTIIRTVDGGYNWTNLTGHGVPTNLALINIFGIDSNIAIVSGYQGINTFVYRTSNGGANWNQVFSQPNGFVDGVWMTTALNGIMVGDPVGGRWSLWKTTNGGVNWDSAGLYLAQAGTEAGWNSSLWADSSKIWFGTNNYRLYYTSNYGLNWAVQSTGSEQNSYMVAFRIPDKQYGLTGGNTLLLTSNGGLNWQTVTAPGTGIFNGSALAYSYMSVAWYIRSSNTIYRSWFPYTGWMTDYTAPGGTYNSIALARQLNFGPGMLFAVRSNGGITRGTFIVEGVRWLSNKIPSTFKLHQNYPNPFNPITKIKLEIPLPKNNIEGEIRGERIVIKIYNALGQETETILDQITQPGIYEATWDGTNCPSGVYFYRALLYDPKFQSAAPEYIETKKMVLIR